MHTFTYENPAEKVFGSAHKCFYIDQWQLLAFRMEQFPFHLLLCITGSLAISYHYS